ncbi:MAG: hypothetical protein IJS47_06350 [Clostridia bacterium]|nr:hypothetical protein [Clostridia bacterium]
MIKKTNIAKSLVKVTVGQVPYVGQVVAEVINFIDAEIVNRRLEKLEEEINKRKMSIEEFESRISEFDEHQYYFVRNNLRYYLLNCIPESSKEFCRSVVRYIANEDEELQEEICEIIQNLNEQDINFIKLINSFIKSSNKNELNSKMSIANKKMRIKTYYTIEILYLVKILFS